MSHSQPDSATHPANKSVAFRSSRRAFLRAAGAGAFAVAASSPLHSAARTAFAHGQSTSGVQVFPRHGTWTASPYTEISFRGVATEDLGAVTVIGSESGGHSGVLLPHSDGDGVSFVPDARFQPGELVTVEADVPLERSSDGPLSFGVVQPAPTVPTPDERVTDAPETPPRTFRSRPDLLPPVMDVTVSAGGTAPGLVFLSASIPEGQNGAMILDDNGELVWFAPPNSDLDKHYDVRVQEYQGQPVITFAEATAPGGYGLGHYVMCDSSYQRIAQLQVGNGFPGGDVHEFLLTPRGTALITLYHAVHWDLSPAGGSMYGTTMDGIVQEIDIATGRVLFEWHSLDHVAVDECVRPLEPGADRPYDYFHINSVEDDAQGSLIVSARHTNAIYKIDRLTGEVTWRLNGTQSDFTMGPGTPFAYQHDARVHPNGEMTLFDNAEVDQDADAHAHSRGLVLELDEDAMTATLVREYIHPTDILSVSQGNMQVLPNGNAFIGWGSAPVFSEMDIDGNVLFNGRFPEGGTSYRAYRLPWVGQPADPPDIAAESGAGDAVTVYASWNGATEVASWQVLAGSDPDVLQMAASAPRDGFESAITVQATGAYVAVQALDDAGNVLGTSEAITPV